jgi:hypothetical protein
MVSKYEPAPAAAPPKASDVTFLGQAMILRRLIPSMTMPSDGGPAALVTVEFTPEKVAQLDAIAARLERLSIHEPAIRRMVQRG